jgi:hypothetical protein
LPAQVWLRIFEGLANAKDEVDEDEAELVLNRLLAHYKSDEAIMVAFERGEIDVFDYLS